MIRATVILLVAIVVTGCTGVKRDGAGQLSKAVMLIGKGETDGAVRILEKICADPGIAGITDEALFRLALLSLRPVSEKEMNTSSVRLLRTLKAEYPDSIWTAQSQPLWKLLVSVNELGKQNRSLKSSNQSLHRELKDLQKSIEKLKKLDEELEKQSR